MTLSTPTLQHCTVCTFEGTFTDFSNRAQVQCPTCGALERHRKQAMYLRSFTELFSTDRPLSVLHVAPEPCFYKLIGDRSNINYVPTDLNPANRGGSAEHPITPANLCALPFADKVFDIIICSHVLEHIPTDDDAMDELHRVLSDDGFAILDVPLRHAATTYEDWTITTDEGRTKAFGQYDHVRFYGRDYFEKLGHAGLEAEEVDNFWDENDAKNAQLGHWGIIVARRGEPTGASNRPPHNRPQLHDDPPSQDVHENRSPKMVDTAANPLENIGVKHESELGYWLRQYEAEGGRFHNGWYERMMLAIAEVDDASFFDGKIVADFGCGPRGSLQWCSGASMAIGIDVLVDLYTEQFEAACREHRMTYIRSTESFIPMPDNFVDVMITINSLDHVDNLEEMSAELIRVLKPGGTLLGSFNLEEPANEAEPQQLSERLLDDVLFKYLDVENIRITDQHEGFTNRYEPLLSGMDLTYTVGEEGILWMRATKR